MKATVNRLLFTTAVFDSGSLGMLTSVIHQFSKPGRYQAVIHHRGKPVASRSFEASESAMDMQLNIDLAGSRLGALHREDCACNESGGKTPNVSTKGYVIFYVSQGEGYSVVVAPEDERGSPVFKSQNLGKGDLFALSLLEPTRYSIVNKKGGAKGAVDVSLPAQQKKALGVLESVYVDVTQKGFSPAKLKVTSTQGIVFRIEAPARIVIQRQAAKRKSEHRQPRRIRPLKLATKYSR